MSGLFFACFFPPWCLIRYFGSAWIKTLPARVASLSSDTGDLKMLSHSRNKLAVMAATGLLTLMLASTSARASHDHNLLPPLVAGFALGALVNYGHSSHHYYRYQYQRHGYGYSGHGSGHRSGHGYSNHHRYGHHKRSYSSQGQYGHKPRYSSSRGKGHSSRRKH